VIKKIFVSAAMVGCLAAGVVVPAGPATAEPNSSRLGQCERTAAERYARKLQSDSDKTRARRQFNNDIARCKRRFG